jgi:hypothetical protein
MISPASVRTRLEGFHLQRTRFEMIVERKLRRRQLTETGDVEITGRDLRERTLPAGSRRPLLRDIPSSDEPSYCTWGLPLPG